MHHQMRGHSNPRAVMLCMQAADETSLAGLLKSHCPELEAFSNSFHSSSLNPPQSFTPPPPGMRSSRLLGVDVSALVKQKKAFTLPGFLSLPGDHFLCLPRPPFSPAGEERNALLSPAARNAFSCGFAFSLAQTDGEISSKANTPATSPRI